MSRAKKDKKDGKKNEKVIIRRGRKETSIVMQYTRRFKRIIKSNGIEAAEKWLDSKNGGISVGCDNAPRKMTLPVAKMRQMLMVS